MSHCQPDLAPAGQSATKQTPGLDTVVQSRNENQEKHLNVN